MLSPVLSTPILSPKEPATLSLRSARVCLVILLKLASARGIVSASKPQNWFGIRLSPCASYFGCPQAKYDAALTAFFRRRYTSSQRILVGAKAWTSPSQQQGRQTRARRSFRKAYSKN